MLFYRAVPKDLLKVPYVSEGLRLASLKDIAAFKLDTINDQQPELLKPVGWIEVKAKLIKEVLQYEKNIIAKKENQIKEREQNMKQLLQKKRDKKV